MIMRRNLGIRIRSSEPVDFGDVGDVAAIPRGQCFGIVMPPASTRPIPVRTSPMSPTSTVPSRYPHRATTVFGCLDGTIGPYVLILGVYNQGDDGSILCIVSR